MCNVLRHVVYYTWFAVDVGTSSMTHGIDGIDGMMYIYLTFDHE